MLQQAKEAAEELKDELTQGQRSLGSTADLPTFISEPSISSRHGHGDNDGATEG